jgi:hypothetical protein
MARWLTRAPVLAPDCRGGLKRPSPATDERRHQHALRRVRPARSSMVRVGLTDNRWRGKGLVRYGSGWRRMRSSGATRSETRLSPIGGGTSRGQDRGAAHAEPRRRRRWSCPQAVGALRARSRCRHKGSSGVSAQERLRSRTPWRPAHSGNRECAMPGALASSSSSEQAIPNPDASPQVPTAPARDGAQNRAARVSSSQARPLAGIVSIFFRAKPVRTSNHPHARLKGSEARALRMAGRPVS